MARHVTRHIAGPIVKGSWDVTTLAKAVRKTYGIELGTAEMLAREAVQKHGDREGRVLTEVDRALVDDFLWRKGWQLRDQRAGRQATPSAAAQWRTLAPILTIPFDLMEIHTGGTIAMGLHEGRRTLSDEGLDQATQGKAVKSALLFGLKDSSQLLLNDISEIAYIVAWAVGNAGPPYRVPLITHGTDTLETTAFILSQVFPQDLLVLTAAFHPAGTEGSDANRNYEDAKLVAQFAGDPRVPQVPLVVMNGAVHLAASLIKLDTDYRNGRRGFGSFADPVAFIKNGRCDWNSEFLLHFDLERQAALKTTRQVVHDGLLLAADRQDLDIAATEVIYVNGHTPLPFLDGVVRRLQAGATEALVVQGDVSAQEDFISRLLALKAQGRTVYCEGSDELAPPPGLDVRHLALKIALLAHHVPSGDTMHRVLSANVAGEICGGPVRPELSPQIVPSDFYDTLRTARSFLLYSQDFWVFKSALAEEIARLEQESARGRKVELVIEGLGNGHIRLGDPPPPHAKNEAFLEALSPAARAIFLGGRSLLDLIRYARDKGIVVTMITQVRDAAADGSYKVGQDLAEADVRVVPFSGREYLQRVSAIEW